ncbi:bulb-type lectin domain-containing protein [Artemisia annua]|uniref:Bulb-type lectin domain-containing protein n=1 Tax=Artemisia annua TaxID=35608 RepID=A0A2U1LHQ8_ARTAN|nr:bulb-type lectin domain-containing protein [Artemisia annua]
MIKIKGNIYSTRVTTFNEFVAFLNLIKCDDIIHQEWDYFRYKFDKVAKWFYNHYLNKSLPGPIPPTINGIQVHLLDLYKLIEGLGGYLSVHFGQEFGTIGELIGLSKQDGDELKKCYIKYLDIFTSYYKTARGPNFPTKRVEVDTFSPLSHQETLAPKHTSAEFKGKGKLEHFGIILEDEEEKKLYTKSSQPHTWQQVTKAGTQSVKIETNSNASDDFTT